MNERRQDFELLQADLSQVLPIYGELLGRKLISSQKWSGRSICFRNQTALSRSEALYALDILLSWQNVQAVLADDKQFSLRQFGSGR